MRSVSGVVGGREKRIEEKKTDIAMGGVSLTLHHPSNTLTALSDKVLLAATLGGRTPVPSVPVVTPPARGSGGRDATPSADGGHLVTPGSTFQLPFLTPGWATRGRRARSSPPGGRRCGDDDDAAAQRPVTAPDEPRARSSPPGERGDVDGDTIPAIRVPGTERRQAVATAPSSTLPRLPPALRPRPPPIVVDGATGALGRVLYASRKRAEAEAHGASRRPAPPPPRACPAWGSGPGAPATQPVPPPAPPRMRRRRRPTRPSSAASSGAATVHEVAADLVCERLVSAPLPPPPLSLTTIVALAPPAAHDVAAVHRTPTSVTIDTADGDAHTFSADAVQPPRASPAALLDALAPCVTAVATGTDAAIVSVGDTGPRAATAVSGDPGGVVAEAAAAMLASLAPRARGRFAPPSTDPPLTLAAYALDGGTGRRVDLLNDVAATAPPPPPGLPAPRRPLTLVAVRTPADAAVAAAVAAAREPAGAARVVTLRPGRAVTGDATRRATLFLAAAGDPASAPAPAAADTAALVDLMRAAAAPPSARPTVMPWRSGGPLTREMRHALVPGGGAAALLLHVGAGERDARAACATLFLGERVRGKR